MKKKSDHEVFFPFRKIKKVLIILKLLLFLILFSTLNVFGNIFFQGADNDPDRNYHFRQSADYNAFKQNVLVDRTYYGMKLTENPEEYDAFDIDENGYARIYTKFYKDYYHHWPIPQSELDINPNLQQKDNWVGR